MLVDANQQARAFLAAIEVVAGVADDRHAAIHGGELGDFLGDEVLMLHRHHRVGDADHRADLVDPVARRVDDLFAGDITVLGVDDPLAVRLAVNRFDRIKAVDLRARPTRATRQRLGETARVDVAVDRVPQGTHQAVGFHQRMASPAFVGRQQLELDAHALGHADEVVVAVDVILGVRQTDAAGYVIGDREFRIGCQFGIKPGRVTFEADHDLNSAELSHLRSRMPCRTGRQLVALDQNDIVPAFLGQMVKRAASADAATNHHHPRMCLHRRFPPYTAPVER